VCIYIYILRCLCHFLLKKPVRNKWIIKRYMNDLRQKTIASVCCGSVPRPHRTTPAVTGVRPWHLPKWFVGWTMIAWAAKHHAVWRYTPTISGLNSSSVAPCHVGEQLRHGQGMWGDQLHIAILGSMASLYDLGCWGGRYPMRTAKHKAIPTHWQTLEQQK
jgi:hypothetical protein